VKYAEALGTECSDQAIRNRVVNVRGGHEHRRVAHQLVVALAGRHDSTVNEQRRLAFRARQKRWKFELSIR
jgi:hypothetical protein